VVVDLALDLVITVMKRFLKNDGVMCNVEELSGY